MTTPPAFIIDVRSPQEFAAGHLKGAVNIPHDRIEQAIGSIDGLEKNSAILLYCLSGARSAFACQVLAQLGFTRAVNGGAMATLLLNFERA
ncbi:MAG: rhodanese-like domain-containing protein [Propionivibrio sp.]|jgi:phage shock protein E|nr:rhodanese-like domain-containing protein [Propionivibrio sp.]